jgi:hypothetical protein
LERKTVCFCLSLSASNTWRPPPKQGSNSQYTNTTVAMYGCETWSFNQSTEQKISFQRKTLQNI